MPIIPETKAAINETFDWVLKSTAIINLVLGIIAKEFKTITIDKILVISTNWPIL